MVAFWATPGHLYMLGKHPKEGKLNGGSSECHRKGGVADKQTGKDPKHCA